MRIIQFIVVVSTGIAVLAVGQQALSQDNASSSEGPVAAETPNVAAEARQMLEEMSSYRVR
jgi:hypothetical protein